MGGGDSSHGKDGDEVGDAPLDGYEGRNGQDDHADNEKDGEEHREFELLVGELAFVRSIKNKEGW